MTLEGGNSRAKCNMSRLLKFDVIHFRVKSSGNLSVVKKKMIQLGIQVELLTEYFESLEHVLKV